MRLPLTVALAAALLAPHASARAQDQAEPELNDLLEVLKEETDIATKTRMNSDFVPGIVTVLDAEKLEALGVRTVYDALRFVPGVEATLDGNGAPSATVRNLPFPFNSGSIQILLNSIPIGRESSGLNGSALYLPIEQVERIEFVRGPGSVLYGDAAFQGLLNVITRKDGQRVDVGMDSHQMRSVDLLLSTPEEPLRSSLNLALSQSDDAVTPVGTHADENRFSGVLTLAHGGLAITAQAIGRQMDDEDTRPGSLHRDESTYALEARYDRALREGLDLRVRAQYLDNNIETPNNSFSGRQAKGGAEVFGNAGRHQWLAGVEYVDGYIDTASINGAPIPLPPGVPQPPPTPPVRGKSRESGSVYAQDQIELTERLSTTLGARYDHNSDQGGRVTPRAALVYQVADGHVLKAQYTEGFRSPTFFEQFLTGQATPPDLDFEVNRTTEINYVFQRPHLTARATAYRTRIDNMVFRDFAHNTFGNVAHAAADGVELELSEQIGADWRIDASASYVDAEDNRNPTATTTSIATGPHFMSNLGVLYNPTREWIFGLHWNHIGDRDGAAPDDGRYDLVDVAATRKDLFVDKLDLRVGVDNVFDRKVIELFPAVLGVLQFPYRDRTAFARFTWHW